jgi:hypothetical protein
MSSTETDRNELESAEYDSDSVTGIVFDGLIGAVSGAVGTAAMTVVLLVGTTLGGFDVGSFATVVELIGLDAAVPGYTVAVGYLLFLVGGTVMWPLLFASIGRYLPGETWARQGTVFGAVLWTGFVLAFYTGYAGAALAVYVAATFAGHLAYGFCLGAVFDYLGGREEPLV